VAGFFMGISAAYCVVVVVGLKVAELPLPPPIEVVGGVVLEISSAKPTIAAVPPAMTPKVVMFQISAYLRPEGFPGGKGCAA
jgi:hypothetical protein